MPNMTSASTIATTIDASEADANISKTAENTATSEKQPTWSLRLKDSESNQDINNYPIPH
jgi:hypothetical protein